jgi:membrane-bound lytic murein transglycosylase D
MDVAVAVKLAGMPLSEFQTLNPQMNRPVILAAGTPQVLLPYENANQFVRQLPLHRGALASWTAWTVPKTMRPNDAAKQVGMSEEQLREVNRIPPRMLVKAGSTLLVPRGEHRQADVPVEVADNAMMALAPDAPAPRKVSLKAGRKDSVASIAKRYRVNATQVAQWNGVAKTASFAPGQTIVVFVAGKAVRAKATHTAAHKAAPGKKATRTAAAPRKGSGKHTAIAASGRVRVANN